MNKIGSGERVQVFTANGWPEGPAEIIKYNPQTDRYTLRFIGETDIYTRASAQVKPMWK